jgi:SAM-dependent methyltransferase
VASGNGALVERAQAAFADEVFIACLDISGAAVRGLAKRFAHVHGIVADARKIPVASSSCDIVLSQFGIEYAGLDAVGEAARLVVPGGEMVLHYRGGGIHRQCTAALDAVRATQDARFIPRSIATFEYGFAAIRGGDRVRYETAARDMVPAVRAVESVIRQYGTQVADGTLLRLYRDVKTMHERMQHYEPAEVLGWLRGMQDEIAAYAGRMASMCDAAIDEARFAGVCDELLRRGFELHRREALVNPERDMPLAWALIARRPA